VKPSPLRVFAAGGIVLATAVLVVGILIAGLTDKYAANRISSNTGRQHSNSYFTRTLMTQQPSCGSNAGQGWRVLNPR
jgi:hypothetical protein